MLTANNQIFNSQNAANGVWRNISNWVAFSVHITGVESKVWIEVSNDPNVMTDGPTISAPASPVLSQYTPIADNHFQGVATNTTFYVKNTYVTAGGETTASTQSSLTVTAGNLLIVEAPAADTGGYAVGWNTYISTTSGAETIQNVVSGVVPQTLSLGSIFTLENLRTTTAVVPASNTSGSPNAGINVTPPDVITASGTTLDETALIYDGTTHQAIWTPSCLVYNYVRVCKDTTTQVLTTKAYLFGQQG
jgi:hypothetical protein